MNGGENRPRIAVVGAGAVGGYYGGLLARAGASVVMIGREPFVDAVEARGLFLDALSFQEAVPVEASLELGAVRGADLVLFCVKATDTAAIAREIAPLLSPEAVVLSLQNGVDNVECLAAAGIAALPAVVYIAASVPEPGRVKHAGRGDLVIGPETETTRRLALLFERAGVPCRISANIEGELWEKFICNCALNAVSALGQARYGRINGDAGAVELVAAVIGEVLAVARAMGVVLPRMGEEKAALAATLELTAQIGGAFSSTAQDLKRRKPTEIDVLNGFIARRGSELGVPTPVNHALFTLVKLAEGREE
ncbi:ketopantoate reductase [Verrucomicrobium sp. GAS474]|uniref:ketopantoate reductase family protein n=1 Tax=Verrucomicrobium sp. GAS474 TaxID=1882831 RepID=UPI00087D8A5C|nr:2-dehydropantoate 2-reductase [Verrucomicrobium sp. GAS474]SDT95861.1 ketopantoate reductase [Verrucomicrobium sp. GAS474]